MWSNLCWLFGLHTQSVNYNIRASPKLSGLQTRTLTPAGSAEPQRAGTASQRGVSLVPAGRSLAGRGVRVRALPVDFALVLIHPQRRHGQLLPVDNNSNNCNNYNIAAPRNSQASRSKHPHPPFLSPSVARVSEPFGKRVVVNLQLRNLEEIEQYDKRAFYFYSFFSWSICKRGPCFRLTHTETNRRLRNYIINKSAMWGVIHIAPRETFCHKMFLYGATQASAAPEMRQRGQYWSS